MTNSNHIIVVLNIQRGIKDAVKGKFLFKIAKQWITGNTVDDALI